MQFLLTVVVLWLAVNFGLPATLDHPQVALVTAEEMAAIRRDRLAAATEAGVTRVRHPAPAGAAAVFAMYDDTSRTLYLPEGWSARDPADVSLLVHEMVHHLQNAAGETFACAAAREKLAYRAQQAWLALFGTTLEREFGLDPMTVLVRTNCL